MKPLQRQKYSIQVMTCTKVGISVEKLEDFLTQKLQSHSEFNKCFKLIHIFNNVHFFSRMPNKNIYYSDKYTDEKFEYRHVMLPKDLAKLVPKTHLMSETEWRNLGVQQSQGWVHYMTHDPEPHILLFRRAAPDQNQIPN